MSHCVFLVILKMTRIGKILVRVYDCFRLFVFCCYFWQCKTKALSILMHMARLSNLHSKTQLKLIPVATINGFWSNN